MGRNIDIKTKGNKPTYEQLEILVGFAFKKKIVTYQDAANMINYITTRPTEKQIKFLKKYSIYKNGITRKEATKQISEIIKSWELENLENADLYYDYFLDIPNM